MDKNTIQLTDMEILVLLDLVQGERDAIDNDAITYTDRDSRDEVGNALASLRRKLLGSL